MPEPESIKRCQLCKDERAFSWSELKEHVIQKHPSALEPRLNLSRD